MPSTKCDRCYTPGNRKILDLSLCEQCWDELLTYRGTWEPPMTASQIVDNIRSFMNTDPGFYTKIPDRDNIFKFFDSLVEK